MARLSYIVAATALVGGLAIAGFASAEPRGGGRHGGDRGGEFGVGGHRPMGGQIDFVTIDTDHDGSLSRAELMARATARIATADGNNDGSLDRAELAAALPGPNDALVAVFSASPTERMADRILALTGNTESGSVPVQVLAERQVNMLLAKADTDRNAAISQEEADAGQSPHRFHRGGFGPGGFGPGEFGPDGSGPGGPGMRSGGLDGGPELPEAAAPESNG